MAKMQPKSEKNLKFFLFQCFFKKNFFGTCQLKSRTLVGQQMFCSFFVSIIY